MRRWSGHCQTPRRRLSRGVAVTRRCTLAGALCIAWALPVILAGGCGVPATALPEIPLPEAPVWMTLPGQSLQVRSVQDDGVAVEGGFDTGMYAMHDDNSVTVILLDGPPSNPTQAMTLRMFWRPRAGLTPLDATATNATMHYIVFPRAAQTTPNANPPVGIYTGAGFLYPKRTPGNIDLLANVWQASLRLSDSAAGFVDLLGPATISGDFRATRDDAAVQDALRQLNQLVADRLGYPRLVGDPPINPNQREPLAAR